VFNERRFCCFRLLLSVVPRIVFTPCYLLYKIIYYTSNKKNVKTIKLFGTKLYLYSFNDLITDIIQTRICFFFAQRSFIFFSRFSFSMVIRLMLLWVLFYYIWGRVCCCIYNRWIFFIWGCHFIFQKKKNQKNKEKEKDFAKWKSLNHYLYCNSTQSKELNNYAIYCFCEFILKSWYLFWVNFRLTTVYINFMIWNFAWSYNRFGKVYQKNLMFSNF
jgi:hypothetical protein